MKRIIYLSFVLLPWINLSLSQQADSFKIEFLKNAPPKVKEYCRVFDSLANPTWQKWVYETWSDDELKKYASLLYETSEYDAIKKRKIDHIRYKPINDAKRGWVVRPISIIQELEKRFPLRYSELIRPAYWLTIVVEKIESEPFAPGPLPPQAPKMTQKNVYGRITNVWKSQRYKVGDNVKCYYLWAPDLVEGNSYIVAITPLVDYENDELTIFALGGPESMRRAVFPIQNDIVTDEENVFQAGKKVDLKVFIDSLTSTINEIKSWRNLAR
jgi:hypothetical protein